MPSFHVEINHLNKVNLTLNLLCTNRIQGEDKIETLTELHKDPVKVLSLSDIISFSTRKRMLVKVKKETKIVEESLLANTKANLETIDFTDANLMPYCLEVYRTHTKSHELDEFVLGKYSTSVMRYVEYLLSCKERCCAWVFMLNSVGKHSQLQEDYVRCVEYVVLKTRLVIAEKMLP